MDAVEILNSAFRLEKTGEDFYVRAADSSTDPSTQDTYRMLREEELLHATVIRRQLNALTSGFGWQAVAELNAKPPADLDAPIFKVNTRLLEQLPENASEEDALLFALSVEVKTYELYMKGARQVQDERGRDMFLKLAAVERGHLDLLLLRYESRFGYPR